MSMVIRPAPRALVLPGVLGVFVLGVLSACAGETTGGPGDCTSSYEPVATAETFPALRREMLANEDWGHVARLRTQAVGDQVGKVPSGKDVVRVMDLLDRDGRRLVQVDVWREDGAWRAGAWSQCID